MNQGEKTSDAGALKEQDIPSPPRPPPPSLQASRTQSANLEYQSLGTPPDGSRTEYFSPPLRSKQASGSSPPLPTSSSGNSLSPHRLASIPHVAQHTNLDATPFRLHNDINNANVVQPGAAERLRNKLAEHRKSTSAAMDAQTASRVRDFALEAKAANKSPPLSRGRTFDNAISDRTRSETDPKAASSQTQNQDVGQYNAQTAVPGKLSSSSISNAHTENRPTASHSRMQEHVIPRSMSDAFSYAQPSPAVKPIAGPSRYAPGMTIETGHRDPPETPKETSKPFFRRAFTRNKRPTGLLGASSNSIAGPSGSYTVDARPSQFRMGTASTTEAEVAPQKNAFSLAAARQPSSMSATKRRPSKAPPVGVAIPNQQRKREPTWSAKARQKPLYSLGKPLPTHEEVQAQRQWQEQMERLKEAYPDADPPAPPPLPSQQTNFGGLQIDQNQLLDVIRLAISEFKKYENGELDPDAVSSKLSTSMGGSNSKRARRSTLSAVDPIQRRFPDVLTSSQGQGQGLTRMESMAIDEDDGPPLEEYPSIRRSGSPRRSTFRSRTSMRSSAGAGLPSIPSRGPTPSRPENRSKPSERKPSVGGLPAVAQEGKHTEEGGQALQRDDHSAASNIGDETVFSRDHETEGNYSDDDLDAPNHNNAKQNSGGDEMASLAEEEQEYDEDDEYPNIVAKLRLYGREPFAEFLGAFVLAAILTGASAQATLSSSPAIQPSGAGSQSVANNLSVPLASGAAVAMSVYIAGGISGGHISPAITLVLAVFRGFPWSRVPSYIAGQLLGFLAGSGLAYGLYRHAISIYEGGGGIRTIGLNGTASFFATYPLEYVSNANAFFQEFVNVALLIILVLAIGDADNVPPPAGLNPIIIMFMVMAIGLGFGIQTAYCLNPARDLGPRLVSWFAGYGVGVWEYRNHYWLWGPWLADITGGMFGALMYDTLIFMGGESPMNKKWHVPGISKLGWAENISRDWQGVKLHNKARIGGWRARMRREDTKSVKEEV